MTHLDGHVVEIKRHGVTQPGELSVFLIRGTRIFIIGNITGFVQMIKGEGLPVFEQSDTYGDLFVEYNVVLPTKLSPALQKRKYINWYIFD